MSESDSPSTPFIHAASAKRQAGDLAGALRDADEAVRVNPSDSDARNLRGAIRLDNGDVQNALADFNEALRLNPDNYRAYFNRGLAREQRKDLQGARDDYERALQIDPSYERARQAMDVLQRAMEQPQKPEDALYAGALKKFDAKDFTEALKDIRGALAIAPENADLWNLCTAIRLNLGDLDGAITDATETLRLNPSHHRAWYNRGYAKELRNDFKGAMEDYEHALRIAPTYEHARSAMEELRRRIAPAVPAATYNSAYEKYTARDYPGALRDIESVLKTTPGDAGAWNLRGITRAALDDKNGALADYNECLRLNPSHFRALYNRGLVKERLENFSGALEDYDRAVQIDGSYEHARSAGQDLRKRMAEAGADRVGGQAILVSALLMILFVGLALGVLLGGIFGGMKLSDVGYNTIGIICMGVGILGGLVLVPLAISAKIRFGITLFETILSIRTGRGIVGFLLFGGSIYLIVLFIQVVFGGNFTLKGHVKELIGNVLLILLLFFTGLALMITAKDPPASK